MLLHDHGGDDLAVEQPRVVRRARRKRDVDVEAVGARRLRHADGAKHIELVTNPAGHIEHARESDALGWIEVERGVVGELRVVHARKPRILRDCRELRHVQQRLQVAPDDLRPLFNAAHDLSAHAGGHLRGAVLIERRCRDAVGEALHDQRPIGDGRQHEGRGADVIAEEIALRQLLLRPENLMQVRDAQPVATGEREHTVAAGLLQLRQLIEQHLGPGFGVQDAGSASGSAFGGLSFGVHAFSVPGRRLASGIRTMNAEC